MQKKGDREEKYNNGWKFCGDLENSNSEFNICTNLEHLYATS